jgi:hypothetical protein
MVDINTGAANDRELIARSTAQPNPTGASVSGAKKTGHGTPWTNEDVRALKAHSKARTPLAEIAKKMKRTEGALRRKAGILGIGVGHRR